MKEQKKKYRIGFGMVFILIMMAGVADIVSLIPFVGTLVGPTFWVVMSWYLWKTGHGLLNWKTIIPEGISVVAEIIPVIQELPTIIVATIVIVVISRVEDKTGISLANPLSKGQKVRLPSRTPPFNEGGIRKPMVK